MLRLTSFGFIRSPQDDFTDDGSTFTCYRYPGLDGMRVSVCKSTWSDDSYFIAARMERGDLIYAEYSALPCYKELDMLNDGCGEEYAKQHLPELIEAMKTYHKAYKEKVASLEPVTDEEILEIYRNKYSRYYKEKVAEIKSKIDYRVLRLDEWSVKNLSSYFKSLEGEVARYDDAHALRLSQSWRRQERLNRDKPMSECFYYRECKEILAKVGV